MLLSYYKEIRYTKYYLYFIQAFINCVILFLGKTLLLMAKVMELNRQNKKILFASDCSKSSKMFNDRIRIFCDARGIEFRPIFSNSLEEEEAKADFTKLLEAKADHCLAIDELSTYNLGFVVEATSHLSLVVCVVNPGENTTDMGGLEVPDGWHQVALSLVMRNTAKLYSASVPNGSEYFVDGVKTSTVFGLPPMILAVLEDDLMLGLIEALEKVDEQKFVIILDDIEHTLSPKEVKTAVHTAKPGLPTMFAAKAADRLAFLSVDQQGCLIASQYLFRGMEAKCVVTLNKSGCYTKDQMLRATNQLIHVLIPTVEDNNYNKFDPDDWAWIIPYKQETEEYEKLMVILTQKEDYPAEKIERIRRQTVGYQRSKKVNEIMDEISRKKDEKV